MSDLLVGRGEAESRRSLWITAGRRMRANRAAMISIALLFGIIMACIAGPWLLPNKYDQIFQDFVRVEPSLQPYPKADQLAEALNKIVARLHVTVASQKRNDQNLDLVLNGERPLDKRLLVYFERSNMFGEAEMVDQSQDGLKTTVKVPIRQHWFLFGTDANGRDLLTRTLVAGRISMLTGLLAATVALVIGVVYGAVAAYRGGQIDNLMMRLVDILYALPFIFLAILLLVLFGRQFFLMFIAIGAISWLDMARIVRGQTLSLKHQEFVQAAEALGVGAVGILRRHIIPNLIGTVIVYLTLLISQVILLESFLSYLGLGVPEPLISWGVLISDGSRSIQGAVWLLLCPAVFLTLTLFCLNFIGDGLRDALDPKDR